MCRRGDTGRCSKSATMWRWVWEEALIYLPEQYRQDLGEWMGANNCLNLLFWQTIIWKLTTSAVFVAYIMIVCVSEHATANTTPVLSIAAIAEPPTSFTNPLHAFALRSHSRTVPSSPAVTNESSAGDISIERTRAVWPLKYARYALSCVEWYRTAWSPPCVEAWRIVPVLWVDRTWSIPYFFE